MPILFVNGKRSGVRARGRVRVAGLARRRKNPGSVKRKVDAAIKSAIRRRRVADAQGTKRRARRKKGSSTMAKRRRKKRQPAGLARYWRGRRKAGKHGRPGKTYRRKRRRARKAASAAPKRRRRRRKAASAAPKRRRRRARKGSAPKRRRRRKASATPKRRRRRRKSSTKRSRTRRTRRRRRAPTVLVLGPGGKTIRQSRARTLKGNPGRRRRRRSRRHGRRGRRRLHRRYRSYRKNPGGMLMDLAKRAIPVLLGLYGTRLAVSKIGPMIPGVSALGTFQGPALAIGAVLGVNFATKKIGALAKHRNELLLGSALAALDSVFSAFAPASVKAMLGMGDVYDRGLSDYVAVGDYVSMGATPIDDDIAMSDYIAVGSDGVMEELGMGVEEELGVEEDLGNDAIGGMPGGASLLKQVPGRQFLQPIPARSFTKQIPAAGQQYDNPGQLYNGIFNRGF